VAIRVGSVPLLRDRTDDLPSSSVTTVPYSSVSCHPQILWGADFIGRWRVRDTTRYPAPRRLEPPLGREPCGAGLGLTAPACAPGDSEEHTVSFWASPFPFADTLGVPRSFRARSNTLVSIAFVELKLFTKSSACRRAATRLAQCWHPAPSQARYMWGWPLGKEGSGFTYATLARSLELPHGQDLQNARHRARL
jgi:hypothetical protein